MRLCASAAKQAAVAREMRETGTGKESGGGGCLCVSRAAGSPGAMRVLGPLSPKSTNGRPHTQQES